MSSLADPLTPLLPSPSEGRGDGGEGELNELCASRYNIPEGCSSWP
jgi:hypothetical protein